MSIRQLEDWELKYYKLSINKQFKFFRWEISFNFQILNSGIRKEWAKIMKEAMKDIKTTTNTKGEKYIMFKEMTNDN